MKQPIHRCCIGENGARLLRRRVRAARLRQSPSGYIEANTHERPKVIAFISNLFFGTLAGAAGTATLNALTYADMALRGRPPSELPDKMVRKFAELAGCTELAKPQTELNDRTKHQRTGYGALLGYADGFAAGAIFGAVRPALRGIPWFWCGIALGALTMAMSEGTATALGQTDPAEWPLSAWLSDIGPRCVYGWVTCITYDGLTADR
ncbi:MAG: hypothetical protein ACREM8_14205 [Vulcanimicrobiaceae bacterium]